MDYRHYDNVKTEVMVFKRKIILNSSSESTTAANIRSGPIEKPRLQQFGLDGYTLDPHFLQ